MARIEIWNEQDLQKPVTVKQLIGSTFSEDNAGTLIGAKVTNNGVPVALTGSVTGYIVLPDGTTVSVSGTREDDKAYILLPQSALLLKGSIFITVKLIDSSTITTLAAYVATVTLTKTGTVITPSQEIITDWANTIAAQLQECDDAITNLGVIVAPAFAKTTANAAKTYVTKDGNLYYLPNGHTANTEWADTTKTQVTVGGQLTSLDAKIDTETANRQNADTAINNKIGSTALPTTAQTLTGAIAEHETDITEINTEIGNADLPTTAQTLTGAIAEHEGDLTNQQGQINELKSATNDLTDCVQHNLIPYACNGSSTNSGFMVTQNGNETTLTGTSTATAGQAATKFLLTDHIQIWDATSVPSDAKVYPIKTMAGHLYKLKAAVVSGTRDAGTGTGLLTFRLVDSSKNLVSFTIGTSDTAGEQTFISTGESIQIRMFVARLMTLTNAVIRIELEDITEAQRINDINSMFEPYKLSDGYNASNTISANIPRAPFMFPFEKNGAIIQKIKIGIKTAGTISIGIYNGKIAIGEAYDSSKYTLIKTYSVVTGMNEIVLDNPIITEIGKTLAVYQTTDTSVFGYGSYGQKGNCYYVDSNGDIAKLGYSSNMTITGIGHYNSNVSVFKGKRISIFGDSISTFKGWIPEGNATFYTGSNYGVSSVNDTWWKKTIDALELELLVNNSWSGRAVSSCRDNTEAHATDAGYKEANVLQLKDGDVLPEIIIVKLGINDFNHGAYLGTYDGSTALPSDPTLFLDAYAMMLNLIMTNFPLADVYCCTLMQCEQNNAVVGFPEINAQGESLIAWNEGIRKLAHAFGAKILDHDICGLTYYNLSTYMGDYSSSSHKGLHPNKQGHSLIANQTIHDMDNCVRTRY